MKPARFAFLALATLSACAAPPLDPGRIAEIDRIVEKHLARSGAPGFAIGIIEGKKVSVLGYGRVSKDSQAKPRGDTLYEIGSITKVFTAFLLADLAQEGVVKLNDPIRVHLPADVASPRSADGEIVLSLLATHRSGLPRLPANLPAFSDDPYANYGEDRLYDFLKTHRLKWAVDSRYEYSNLGVGLLGHILERASKTPYEQLVIRRLTGPLRMGDTRTTLLDGMKERLAPPYSLDGKPSRNWNFQVLAGAGALKSSVDDLLKFAAANLGKGDPRLVETLATCHAVRHEPFPARLRVGLAWNHSPVRAGGAWVTWHNGGTGGYSAFIGFVKETGTAVVILANASPAIPPSPSETDQAGFELLELLNP